MNARLSGVCPLLQIFDMPAALAFYRDVLGMRVIGAAPAGAPHDAYGWAWLQADGAGPETQLMLNTAYDPDVERPPVPDAARVAAHGDTVVFFGCPDVDALYQHLRAHGVAATPPTQTSYGMRSVSCQDPDGFALTFHWPVATPAPAGPGAPAE